MPLRTINAPGVQINEIDESLRSPAVVGNSVLVTGFADSGLSNKPYEIASLQDYKTIFGLPSNEAERYFYHACKEVLRNNGRLIAVKLPYDNTMDQNYKAVGIDITGSATTVQQSSKSSKSSRSSSSSENSLSSESSKNAFVNEYDAVTGDITSLTNIENYIQMNIEENIQISNSDYLTMKKNNHFETGGNVDGDFSINPNFVIVNEEKTKVTGLKENEGKEGLFVAIADPFDGLHVQRIIEDGDDDIMSLINGLKAYNYDQSDSPVLFNSSSQFTQNLTAKYSSTSFSEELMTTFPSFVYDSDGKVTSEYNHYITVNICKSIQDRDNQGKMTLRILESFFGSIHGDARDPDTGQNAFICDIVNASSNYVAMYPLKNNSDSSELGDMSETTALYLEDRPSTLIGFSKNEAVKTINSGDIQTNLITILNKEEISNVYNNQIDIVTDAGVSTIAQFINDKGGSGKFEPESNISNLDITSTTDTGVWSSICSTLLDLCKNIRKDCMLIYDGPRNLVLDASQPKLAEPTDMTFSTAIGSKLKYLQGVNSSYAAGYINWLEVFDGKSGKNFWLPQSAKTVGNYLYNDRVANYWSAPAGFSRGVMNGVIRLSFNPHDKEEGQIYRMGLNYAKFYPNDGFVIEGQKTSQVKPSAFDRVNVRRLFLKLERFTRETVKYYKYQNNNSTTRRRVINALEPKFREVTNKGGMYDYQIKCDKDNNPPEVIDQNELKVDIAIKPVRTAEFILVNFYAVSTGADFSEVL